MVFVESVITHLHYYVINLSYTLNSLIAYSGFQTIKYIINDIVD